MTTLKVVWEGEASEEQILKLNDLVKDPVFADVSTELIGKRPNDRG